MGMEDLPGEVRPVRRIEVAYPFIPHSSYGEIDGDWRPKAAGSGYEDRRVLDLLLGLDAPAFHHHLSVVAVDLFLC